MLEKKYYSNTNFCLIQELFLIHSSNILSLKKSMGKTIYLHGCTYIYICACACAYVCFFIVMIKIEIKKIIPSSCRIVEYYFIYSRNKMCVFIVIHFDTNKYPYILLCDEKSPRSVHLSRHGSSVSVSATLVPYSLRGRRPVVSGIPSEYIHIYIHVYMHTYDVYARVSYVRIHVCVCVYVSLSFSISLSI